MKLPIGKLSGEEIDRVFNESIAYHIKVFYDTLGQFEPRQLYSHWRSIVRSIDEMINIPMELNTEEEVKTVLGLRFNFMTPDSASELTAVLELLEKNFNKNIAIRFSQLEKFYKRFGHSSVPEYWNEDPKLAIWVSYQRRPKKPLSKEKRSLLNQLSFQWQPRKGRPRKRNKTGQFSK